MHPSARTLIATLTLLFLACATVSTAGQIRLSAAASMTNVLRELIAEFTATNPEITVIPNFGPSGGLAKQIEQGAPADIYISANRKWMTYLVEKQLIDPGTVRVFAYNTLVFVGREHAASSFADLPALRRIGIGSPASVPAGQYAAQALKAAGLYEKLQEASLLVMAKDVRQALIYADRGETDGSFVYATDALLATSARVLFTVPQELYDRVAYPIALTQQGKINTDAGRFVDFIGSATARAVMVNHGFTLEETAAK